MAVLLCAAIVFALTPLFLSLCWAKKFSPQKPGPSKNAIYECGLESKGEAWMQFWSRTAGGSGTALDFVICQTRR